MDINLNIEGIIAEIKGSLARYKENKVYNKEAYEELLGKYSSLITIVELLKNEIEKLEKNKLPSRSDVESIGAIMNLLGIEKLDSNGIKKLKNINSEFGGKKA